MSTYNHKGFAISFTPTFWWCIKAAAKRLVGQEFLFTVKVWDDCWKVEGLQAEYFAMPIADEPTRHFGRREK